MIWSLYSRLFDMFVSCILKSDTMHTVTKCITKAKVTAKSVLIRLPKIFLFILFLSAGCLICLNTCIRCSWCSWCTQCQSECKVSIDSRLPKNSFIHFIFYMQVVWYVWILASLMHTVDAVDAHNAKVNAKSVLTCGCQRMWHVNGQSVHYRN